MSIDPSQCPLCQVDNQCRNVQLKRGLITSSAPPCWCQDKQFPVDLIEKLPVAAKGKACICQVCQQRLTLAHQVN